MDNLELVVIFGILYLALLCFAPRKALAFPVLAIFKTIDYILGYPFVIKEMWDES